MEEETIGIIAIGVAIIALLACFGVYTMIPEATANPVTWSAIDQYNDNITAIQLDITELEKENPNYNYDNVLDSLRDDINDLIDDIDDLEDDCDDCDDCKDGIDGTDGINGTDGADGEDAGDYTIDCETICSWSGCDTTCVLVSAPA